MVDPNTKQILARWQALADGPAMKRATLIARILSIIGLVMTIFVIYASAVRLNPTFIAAAALVAGWVVAEGNALRTRQAQWPIFKAYLDWNRVHQDLNDGT
jgi:hypothetical protein